MKRAVALTSACLLGWGGLVRAQQADAPVHPEPRANRWQEDWSALADPGTPRRFGDALKYIPLGTDAQTYLSLGATLRERFEANDAPALGVATRADGYVIQRAQVHADLRIRGQWQVFVQLEDARAYDKRVTTPTDRNPLDLRLAFAAYVAEIGDNTFKARLGRQEFAFDLQRFVSLRDGPNVRQAFDAVWADWETRHWRFIGLYSQPVQYADRTDFDDTSSRHFRFSMLRLERKLAGDHELSAYYARYQRDNARYLDGTGNEKRDVLDSRFSGSAHGLDWDLEGMLQRGDVGAKNIRAWAIGTRAGYTFAAVTLAPRLGLQVDAASGDAHRGDGTVGTFNPLFPNGYYLTLAGYSGYANFIHVKPSLTLKPVKNLSLTGALGFQWRQTTHDAVYTQPNVAVPGTAGRGGRWTGRYAQLRADYAYRPSWSFALELVHFDIGQAVRQAGGHDSDYAGLETKFLW